MGGGCYANAHVQHRANVIPKAQNENSSCIMQMRSNVHVQVAYGRINV